MATSIAPMAPVDPPVIKAAGGILQRSTPRGDEVMVVYRKRHQDWTLPRGKVKDGESFQEAAMREVQEETGCACKVGNYLGTISYSDDGVPKVVLFWKMTFIEDRGNKNTDEIGETLWLTIPAAIERLSHAQEKALLSRIGSFSRPATTQQQTQLEHVAAATAGPAPQINQPLHTAAPQISVPQSRFGKSSTMEDSRAHARLLRECEAFRVELGFLERRNAHGDNFWSIPAHEQLNNVQRSLESNDI